MNPHWFSRWLVVFAFFFAFIPDLRAQGVKQTLRGIVVDEAGSPIKGARIECQDRASCRGASTRADGTFQMDVVFSEPAAGSQPTPRMRVGQYSMGGGTEPKLHVSRKGYNWRLIDVAPDDAPGSDLRIVLTQGGNLLIGVEGVDKSRWGEIQVKVAGGGREITAGAPITYQDFTEAGVRELAGFEIRDVPQGEARVDVLSPGGSASGVVPVKLGEEATLIVHAAKPKPAITIQGHLTMNELPVSDVQGIQIVVSRPGEKTGQPVPVAPDGSFSMAVPEPGEYVVTLTKKGTTQVDGKPVVFWEDLDRVTWNITESGTRDLKLKVTDEPKQ